MFSEGANLWDIWESIEVLLSSGEGNVLLEVTGDGLSPSAGSTPGACGLVGGHSVTPGLGNTSPCIGSFVCLSPGIAIISLCSTNERRRFP